VTLEEAIKRLAKNNVDSANDWYSWRTINESRLPAGINLPQGNQYEKNLALKTELNKKLKRETDHEEKKRLLKYYISTWGGIHGNSDETLNKYTRATTDELIAMGSHGIASWSKALCVHNPGQFAIFDARVSASMNALQIIENTENIKLYPVLTSRNNTIKKGIKFFKGKAKKEGWESAPECSFYREYLGYLKNAASSLDKNLGASVATIEMLLFSKAEELVRKAFPNEKF
jgi:hypothetical protein